MSAATLATSMETGPRNAGHGRRYARPRAGKQRQERDIAVGARTTRRGVVAVPHDPEVVPADPSW